MKVLTAFKATGMSRGKPKPGSLNRKQKIFRIVKITAIILLAGCLQVSAAGISQTVTLREKNAPLKKIIQAIERQTGYTFFYENKLLQQAKPVSINVQNLPLPQVLEICFKDQPLTYSLIKNQITIKLRETQLSKKKDELENAQLIDVNGRVINKKGEPIPGATVTVKGITKSAITNTKGEFSLPGVPEDAVIEISSIGYETGTYPLNKQLFVNVVLEVKISALDETIVIAYGTTTRRFATGNIATVKAADIEKQPVQNPLLALQGRVPGVEIIQLSGMNGAGVTVRIQGRNSINSGLEPLVVVDGVPYPTQLSTTVGAEDVVKGGSPLNFINPADIESIDVLKDADATAIYGSRAANGAILITTKKGKAGRTKLNINLQQGWGKVTRRVDMMNTRQYLDMRYGAFKNDGRIPSSSTSAAPYLYAPDLAIWDTTRYTDWQKDLIGGTAQYTNLGASISGGTPAVQYLIGTTFNRQTDVFPGDFDDKRAGLHFNINGTSANQKLRLLLSGSYFFDRNSLPTIDLTEKSILLEPNAPALYNADGSLNWAPNAAGSSTWENPLAYIENSDFFSTNKNLVSNLNLSYSILPGLNLRSNIGYTHLQSDLYKPFRLETYRPEWRTFLQRVALFSDRNMNSWIIEPELHYTGRAGKCKIEGLVGATIQQSSSDVMVLWGKGYTSDLLMKSIKTAPAVEVDVASNSSYKYSAFFGRLNYTWDDKYIVNLTGRRDGSSRFGDKSKVHNFGSIGLGWIFSEEKWIKQALPFLSFGKLRGSYGTTGNDQIADYSYLSLYGVVSAPVSYQNTSSLGVGTRPSNPHLQWEETRKWQGGIDLGFVNDRVVFGATYARNRSSNQLISYVLPTFTGFDNMTQNFPATIQNTSWEFTLNSTNFKRSDFTWTSSFNLTIPQNKLVSFPNIELTSYANDNLGVIIGQPLGIIKVYRHAGVDPVTGKYLVFDKDGNPTNNPNFLTDKNLLISSQSTYYGGFLNSISYKGFQLDFLFQFVRQKGARDLYYWNGSLTPGRFASSLSNQPVTVLNHWQKPGDNTEFARYSVNHTAIYPSGSDVYYTYDASYIRLKNLSLSWQLPSYLIKKAQIQNARLYFRGQNLATITNYTGLDPETRSISTLPPLQIWTVGAQLEL